MEAQTIFTQVIQHLVRQGCAAIDSGGCCAYRGEDGTKCAAGYLITEAEMESINEGVSWHRQDYVPERLHEHEEVVRHLQTLHDIAVAQAAWNGNWTPVLAEAEVLSRKFGGLIIPRVLVDKANNG